MQFIGETMSQGTVRVLLLGETARASSHLLWHLERRGCYCWFATSAEQGVALFNKHKDGSQAAMKLVGFQIQKEFRAGSMHKGNNSGTYNHYPKFVEAVPGRATGSSDRKS